MLAPLALFIVVAAAEPPAPVYRLRGAPVVAFARRAKVYAGPEGVEVVVVRAASAAQGTALVVVRGVDEQLDGRVLRHDVTESAGAVRLTTTLHGKRATTLVGEPDDDGALVYALELPGMKRPVRLRYDAAKSAREDAAAIADEDDAAQRRARSPRR